VGGSQIASGTFTARSNPTPYLQQFSLSVQRELTQNVKLEVAYVGTKGTHLQNQYTTRNSPLPGPGPIAARRPIPNLGGFSTFENNGNLVYHSLQATLTSRSWHGMNVTSAFTWQKGIDENSGFFYSGIPYDVDYRNRGLDRGRSDMDVTLRSVTSLIYELPVGRGKRFLNRSGFCNVLLGGWQTSA